MSEFLPVNIPDLSGNELKYVSDCVKTGWISSGGSYVRQFEEQLSSYVGRKHGIAITNGTAALQLACRVLGIGKGDEVIVPAFSIISCAGSIVEEGAVPILVDSHLEDCNMMVDKIEEKITSKTKAIMVVHTYGMPVDMDPVLALCKKHNLKLIEDAAEMHGQSYKGKKCGSFGDISTFSFYPNKHVTTGEGGMVVCDDDELAEKCRLYRNLCFTKERFIHEKIGWNLRMTNLQAALGVAQCERLDDFVKRKRAAGAYYTEKLQGLKDKFDLPPVKYDYADNVYWVYPLLLKDSVKPNARDVIKLMGAEKIGCRPFFYSMHMQPVFKTMGLYDGTENFPNAKKLSLRGFYIPMGTGITREQQDRVVAALKKVFAQL